LNRKLLAITSILLFIGAIIGPSTAKDTEFLPKIYPLESVNSPQELFACNHVVYFGHPTYYPWECGLYKGILNDIGNSTCICGGGGPSGDFISDSTWTNDGRLIGCEYSSGVLWEIDIENCGMTSIGGGGQDLNGLSFDPVTNQMYGVGGTDDLYKVDYETGEVDYVGSGGTGQTMIDIAFDADGVLYGWDVKFSGESYLYTIDTETGEATVVGGMGMTLCYAQTGDFCKEDDILYLAAFIYSPQYGTYFVECDEDTGDCTILGQFPDNAQQINIFVIPWNFRPYTPSDPYPPSGATGVPIDTDLSWIGGDPDDDYLLYDIYFGNTSPPPKVASFQSNTTYDPGILGNCTTYYWQIVAWDWYNAYREGPIWNFTTNCKPDAPIITGQTNGKIWTEYEYEFQISDPDGDSMHIRVDWEVGPGKWDGDYPSGSIVKLNYSWRKKGTYTIRAQTMDSKGLLSDWGELTVTMPREKTMHNFLFLRFLDRFPLLKYLLGFF